LLAVFPLPESEEVEDNGANHPSVTLEGGQTVALAVALGEGTGGEGRAYVIQLAYAESAAVETPRAAPSAAAALLARPRPETST
jgi:hypothetical protein